MKKVHVLICALLLLVIPNSLLAQSAQVQSGPLPGNSPRLQQSLLKEPFSHNSGLQLNLDGFSGLVTIELVNAKGEVALYYQSYPGLLHLSTASLAKGAYTLRAYNRERLLSAQIVLQ